VSKDHLEILEKTPEFIKVTKYGEETKGHVNVEDVHIKIIDLRKNVETKIALDTTFIAMVNRSLEALKEKFGEERYKVFEDKHFKNKTLETIALDCGHMSTTPTRKAIGEMEKFFEHMYNT